MHQSAHKYFDKNPLTELGGVNVQAKETAKCRRMIASSKSPDTHYEQPTEADIL